ncbi:methyltransferase [Cutibacterium sp. WCA-380-WT-3A]|uniref:Methyltransferase n=1 Tax=Cutibacterium porci TaxID=2605781 RepID=A0A7K0J500_9ACTN|nr:methyltransferase [Cutibacterium porci]MSS44918.1 methyltransferase [Cutibacterium porci]
MERSRAKIATMGRHLTGNEIEQLRNIFTDIGYLTDPVMAAIGDSGQLGLTRNSTTPASRALAGRTDVLAGAIRLWLLQQPVPVEQLAPLPLQTLTEAGIVTITGSMARALVEMRPYGSPDDGASGWTVSDLTPGLDKIITKTRPDYVLGVSPASVSLTHMAVPTHVGSALDMGCGCGVQSLHLSRHADHVVATDVNPRALEMARLTCRLSHADVEIRDGSLYDPCGSDMFDLIVTNPPYVMAPPSREGQRLIYREGGFTGDGLVEAVVRGAPAHLNDGGMLQVLANWAHIGRQPWSERIATWVEGTGCDLWVVEREHLDVYEYIETWLTDAGLDGSAQWRSRYDEWLSYFDDLDVTGVSLGWIIVTKAGRDNPDLCCEEWPWQVAQPIGETMARHAQSVTWARLNDEDLLARRWRIAPDVDSEATGRPGAADPEHIVLRQRRGLCRAVDMTTASGGVLGACDGELTLAQITDAVCAILEVGRDAMLSEVLPLVRKCLRYGILEAA